MSRTRACTRYMMCSICGPIAVQLPPQMEIQLIRNTLFGRQTTRKILDLSEDTPHHILDVLLNA